MTARTVAEVLDAAADLIEPEGMWRQYSYGTPGTCMCVLGAIWAAQGKNDDTTPAVAALRRTLNVQFPHEWNDAPERTQAEVVAKLREAAAKAREQGL